MRLKLFFLVSAILVLIAGCSNELKLFETINTELITTSEYVKSVSVDQTCDLAKTNFSILTNLDVALSSFDTSNVDMDSRDLIGYAELSKGTFQQAINNINAAKANIVSKNPANKDSLICTLDEAIKYLNDGMAAYDTMGTSAVQGAENVKNNIMSYSTSISVYNNCFCNGVCGADCGEPQPILPPTEPTEPTDDPTGPTLNTGYYQCLYTNGDDDGEPCDPAQCLSPNSCDLSTNECVCDPKLCISPNHCDTTTNICVDASGVPITPTPIIPVTPTTVPTNPTDPECTDSDECSADNPCDAGQCDLETCECPRDQQCEDGDDPDDPQEYPQCPENFEELYNGNTIEKLDEGDLLDTRDINFCDSLGDFPTDFDVSATASLTVQNSALRQGTCWFKVKADDGTSSTKPVFYAKYDQLKKYVEDKTPAPANLRVIAKDTSSVTLSWDSVDGSEYYILYKKKISETSFIKVAQIMGVVQYKDSDVVLGSEYNYYVTAYSSDHTTHESDKSNQVTVKIEDDTPGDECTITSIDIVPDCSNDVCVRGDKISIEYTSEGDCPDELSIEISASAEEGDILYVFQP